MSAALVRKSLAIVDPDSHVSSGKNNQIKKKTTSINISEQHQLIEKIERGQKVNKVNLLVATKKLTVSELRKKQKNKKNSTGEALKKLHKLRKVCKIQLDKETTRQLFERAVTGRPVKQRNKSQKSKKTAFTEEDFKRFEEEYFDE